MITQTIYEHNMQYKEFAYIFEDIWEKDKSEPSFSSLDRQTYEAQETMNRIGLRFSEEMKDKLDKLLDQKIDGYIKHL